MSQTNLNNSIDGYIKSDNQASEAVIVAIKKAAADTDSSNATYIGITSTASARAVSLLSADCLASRTIIVKDESGGAATHNITISTEGSEKIDGADTKVMSTNYQSVRVVSDGSNWFII